MRIFEDENGKTNLALKDVSGELLMISQFTLYANCKKETAHPLRMPADRRWQSQCMSIYWKPAAKKTRWSSRGEFGADMKLALVNDGPFTVVLDSRGFDVIL